MSSLSGNKPFSVSKFIAAEAKPILRAEPFRSVTASFAYNPHQLLFQFFSDCCRRPFNLAAPATLSASFPVPLIPNFIKSTRSPALVIVLSLTPFNPCNPDSTGYADHVAQNGPCTGNYTAYVVFDAGPNYGAHEMACTPVSEDGGEWITYNGPVLYGNAHPPFKIDPWMKQQFTVGCDAFAPTWDCVPIGTPGNTTNTCIQITNGTGQYLTLNECQNSCISTAPQSWDCNNDICSDTGTGNGTYPTLADCEAVCGPASSSCVVNLDNHSAYCNNNTGSHTAIATITGGTEYVIRYFYFPESNVAAGTTTGGTLFQHTGPWASGTQSSPFAGIPPGEYYFTIEEGNTAGNPCGTLGYNVPFTISCTSVIGNGTY